MKKLALFGVIVSTFVLVACGRSVSIPSDVVIGGSPQNYLTTPTYIAGTEESNAFYAINSFRRSVGLGYWNQNIYLDTAATYHMVYSYYNRDLIANPYQTDIEIQTNPNFYAVTPSARAIISGYYFVENTVAALNVPTAYVGELYSTGSGADVVSAMVNTIYHRGGLMDQATINIGMARDTAGTITDATPTHWWISHGRLTSSQSVASNYVGLYPFDQATNIPLHMDAENPSVYSTVPGAFDFVNNTSSPVSITTSSLTQLTTTSFTVTQAGSSTPLEGNIWSMANDPNMNTNDYSAATINLTTPPNPVPTIPAYEVFWVGTKPFLPNTTYVATYTGTTFLTAYGITNPITQTWTFTTGVGN